MTPRILTVDQAKALLASAQLRKKTPGQQVYFDPKTNQSHTVTAAGPGTVRVVTVGGCVC